MSEQSHPMGKKLKALILIASAFLVALLITQLSENRSFEERLLQSSLKNTFSTDELHGFQKEGFELQALFLEYSETPELVLKSRIAIDKYGDSARRVIIEYGAESEFKEILAEYGESIIPVVHYSLTNRPLLNEKVESQNEQDTFNFKRGWHAVIKIHEDGHDYLGQFRVTPNNEVKRIQIERAAEAATSFLFSGVRNIEIKRATGEEVNKVDIFWSGIDAALIFTAVKAIRAIKLVRTGKFTRGSRVVASTSGIGEAAGTSSKGLNLLNRTKLFAGKLIPKNAFGKAILKGGVGVATLYIFATHPGLLNSIFAEFAELFGLDPLLVQIVCWGILLSTMCLLLTPVIRILLPLLRHTLSILIGAINQAERLFAKSRQESTFEQNIIKPDGDIQAKEDGLSKQPLN